MTSPLPAAMRYYPGQTVCYSKRVVINRKVDITYHMPARYHGPCPRPKSARCKSDITIIFRGKPKRMRYVNNSQLMTLAEYWQRYRPLPADNMVLTADNDLVYNKCV